MISISKGFESGAIEFDSMSEALLEWSKKWSSKINQTSANLSGTASDFPLPYSPHVYILSAKRAVSNA